MTRPATIALMKCTPHSVETLMVGLLNSIIKLNTEVLARLLSLVCVTGLHISIHDWSGMYEALGIGALISSFGLFGLCFAFSRNEFIDLQKVLHQSAHMSREEIIAMNFESKTRFFQERRETR